MDPGACVYKCVCACACLSLSLSLCVCVRVCNVRACVLHRHISPYIYIIERQRLGVNVNVALPSVGSVVP
jgi:hypothetical protein